LNFSLFDFVYAFYLSLISPPGHRRLRRPGFLFGSRGGRFLISPPSVIIVHLMHGDRVLWTRIRSHPPQDGLVRKVFGHVREAWALLRVSFYLITSHPGSRRLRGPGSRILFARLCYQMRCAVGNILLVSPPVYIVFRLKSWGRVLEGRTRLPSPHTFLEMGY
jgi:hypothetical protein